ncbi:DUF6765 family protein [Pectinatus frisingensis]|jgi:hypothetical protein|uniref:DUF6765 family protein n=1 Tax=Pectinatus frisingensis TaxID=865 RepID=UPI0018C4CC8B|nr:DUF6765 family protein [Pectinatus frisingensis]
MDIDFHFGTIYVLSRWAGFNALDAKALATTSQLVDDNIPALKVSIKHRSSGHEPLENLYDLKDNNEIWFPFHFLPNLNENTANRLICKKNSNLSNQLSDYLKSIVDLQANKNLFRLGVGLHVYADTWAHQEFSGHISSDNIITNPDVIYPKEALWERTEDSFIHDLPPLGHVSAIHWPDRPYAFWKCTPKFPDGRKNWIEFVEAASAIYSILTTVKNSENTLTEEQQAVLTNCFKNFTDEDCSHRNTAWINYINQGNFGFNDSLEEYDKGYILGDSDFCPQFYEAIDDHYSWVKKRLETADITILN